MLLKKFHPALTLVELIIVVVLIGILSSLGVASFMKTIINSKQKEAQSLLLLIQHAEEVVHVENNAYVNCTSTTDCNTQLHLNLPIPASPTWNYIVTSTNPASCFSATATPVLPSGSGLSAWCIGSVANWTAANTTGCTCS